MAHLGSKIPSAASVSGISCLESLSHGFTHSHTGTEAQRSSGIGLLGGIGMVTLSQFHREAGDCTEPWVWMIWYGMAWHGTTERSIAKHTIAEHHTSNDKK
jgi:hypothetical protein